MLKRFSVNNFKNFYDTCVFDFSKTNDYSFNKGLIKNNLVNKALIYGYNGSGKSNLGFAMMDINNHLTDKTKRMDHYLHYLNGDNISTEAKFSYLFLMENGDEVEYNYSKNASMELLFEEVKVNGKTMFQFNYSNDKLINNFVETQNIVFKNRQGRLSALKFMRNNSDLKKDHPIEYIVSFAENMLWFRSVRENEFMGKLENGENIASFIVNNGLIDDFQKFLSDCGLSYKLLAGIDTFGNPVILIDYNNEKIEFFSSISTGTGSLTLFYYWIKKCEKNLKFLYLDEFDSFYHYKLSKKILNFINSKSNFQSVLTTHNPFLADNSIMRPDCYFILNDGKIDSFSNKSKKIIREANSLENMLLSNMFD